MAADEEPPAYPVYTSGYSERPATTAYGTAVEEAPPPPSKFGRFYAKVKRKMMGMPDAEIKRLVCSDEVPIVQLLDQGYSLERIVKATGLVGVPSLVARRLHGYWRSSDSNKALHPSTWYYLINSHGMQFEDLESQFRLLSLADYTRANVTPEILKALHVTTTRLIEAGKLSHEALLTYARTATGESRRFTLGDWRKLGLSLENMAMMAIPTGHIKSCFGASVYQVAKVVGRDLSRPLDAEPHRDLFISAGLIWNEQAAEQQE